MYLTASFILASSSPRRKALLDQIGLPFQVQKRPVRETVDPGLSPSDVVQHLALRKAMPVAAEYPTALTLGADTIVVHNGDILNKPDDAGEAHAMLQRLSGTTHTVCTGYAILHPTSDRTVRNVECTQVTFADLADQEIQSYVATGLPMDKAGGYGIQDEMGPLFVDRIEGDYYTVVGLPLRAFYQTLTSEFADLVSV